MENTFQPVSNVPLPPVEPTLNRSAAPLAPRKHAPWVLIILLIGFMGISGFLFWQNQSLKKQVTVTEPSQAPNMQPSSDPTAGWETFSNDIHGISFKYPKEWDLTYTKGQTSENNEYNAHLDMKKANATIEMYFNMDGLGGRGRDLQGEPFKIDGFDVYLFRSADNKSKGIGVTDRLNTSLGFLDIDRKTYSISIEYPSTEDGSEYEEEFKSILHTFKFAGASVKKVSGWEKYSNAQGTKSYTIDIPKNWYNTKCGSSNGLVMSPKEKPVCEGDPIFPITFNFSQDYRNLSVFQDAMEGNYALFRENLTVEGFYKYYVTKTSPAPGPDVQLVYLKELDGGSFILQVNDLTQESIADYMVRSFATNN